MRFTRRDIYELSVSLNSRYKELRVMFNAITYETVLPSGRDIPRSYTELVFPARTQYDWDIINADGGADWHFFCVSYDLVNKNPKVFITFSPLVSDSAPYRLNSLFTLIYLSTFQVKAYFDGRFISEQIIGPLNYNSITLLTESFAIKSYGIGEILSAILFYTPTRIHNFIINLYSVLLLR